MQTVDKAESESDGKVIQQLHVFPDGKTKLAVIYLQNPLHFKKLGWQDVRVDLIGPEPDRRRTLIETTACCGVYPSPNNELVALRCMVKSKTEEDRPGT